MADVDTTTAGDQLDGGTYEVVLKRLQARADELRQRTEALDGRRRELFGASSVELTKSVKVRSEHACTPRDLVAVGGRLLFGYHAVLGLKNQIEVADVFSQLAVEGDTIVPTTMSLLTEAPFVKDFQDLFRYYKDARLLQMRRPEGRLIASFQTGSRVDDRKVLRWDMLGQGDGESLTYRDNRGDEDDTFPPRHDFAWQRTSREHHVHGEHPHVNVLDTVFVECVGGDLTIKIEDNTNSGEGILAEPVDDATQGLDDAEVLYADLAPLILLRIRPYKEQAWRHFVYNRLTRVAQRLDAIGVSCQQLPESHGLVFPGGVYLADGTCKTFPIDPDGLEIQRVRKAPNGEDFFYVFYQRGIGRYVLLRYNLVQRQVDQPLVVNGFTFLPDGRLVVFRAEDEPSRLHTLQIWKTPFAADSHVDATPVGDGSVIGTLGNRELARAVGDLYQLARLCRDPRPVRAAWIDLLRQLQQLLDTYHWLGDGEAFGLRAQLVALQGDASTVLEEFQKVEQLTANAATAVNQLTDEVERAVAEAAYGTRTEVAAYVEPLVALRRLRGRVATQKEVRYINQARLDELDARLEETVGKLAQEAATFLQRDDSLVAIDEDLATIEAEAARIVGAVESGPLQERLDILAAGLDALVEVANGLELDDSRARTAIIDRIGSTFARLNRARAVLDGRRRDLATNEARADFSSALTLLAQGAANALALCATVEHCDEHLARLTLQIEELEGRFAEFDEFAVDLTDRRIEISDGFAARRQTLLDERQQRAERLTSAADRVLGSITKRLQACADLDELNAVLAGDALVAKLRQVIADLRELDATVKAEDCEGRLKSARDDAVRRLRDKAELFDGDGIKLGHHVFAVNREPLTLTTVVRDGALCANVTGSDYIAPLADPAVAAARELWSQTLPSECSTVYRSEYAAWLLWSTGNINATLYADRDALIAHVHEWMAGRYEDGYERGVHDHDTALLLQALEQVHSTAGELAVAPEARARALLAAASLDRAHGDRVRRQARSLARLGATPAADGLADDLAELCATAARRHGLAEDAVLAKQAGRFLRDALANDGKLPCAGISDELLRRVHERAASQGAAADLREDLVALREADPAAAWRLAQAWCTATADDTTTVVIDEAAALLVAGDRVSARPVHARSTIIVEGLLGRHAMISEGRLTLSLDTFTARLERYGSERLPAWRAWQVTRRELLENERRSLRLNELSPKVLSSFVRNRLVNEIYLPLIGDNLAKQMGSLGEGRRTDLMGLLLLISPPGYGKTTLLEYLAATLGLAFVKINGPALGHEVTNLDPNAAAAAPAKQELEKLNLALELGNNVLLMIDDIQHCSGEFLQKFIPLCDGTRAIEGVWRGTAKRYDLRGKRFVVAMAGNPYTESGGRFRVPDMLANRADTYNLGDIVGGSGDAFAASYVENSLVVNPVLKPITSRPSADIGRLLRGAAGDDSARGELEHPYTAVELQEILTVMRHGIRVRDVLMQVNATYISSAAQADAYRAEPPFFLQGSYRNMAKIMTKVLPAMTPAEVDALVLDHYRQESQTLTTGAEQNLLKLKSMLNILDDAERERWEHICRTFKRRTEMGGSDDPASIAANQLGRMVEGLDRLREALPALAERGDARIETLVSHLGETLAALQRPSLEAKAESKIEIVNTIPKYYGKLYQHHMQVIEQTLIPLMERLGTYIGDTTAARTNLAAVAQDLRGWLSRQAEGDVVKLEDSKEQPDLG